MVDRVARYVPVRLISGTRVASAPESGQFCLVFVGLFTEGGLDSLPE